MGLRCRRHLRRNGSGRGPRQRSGLESHGERRGAGWTGHDYFSAARHGQCRHYQRRERHRRPGEHGPGGHDREQRAGGRRRFGHRQLDRPQRSVHRRYGRGLPLQLRDQRGGVGVQPRVRHRRGEQELLVHRQRPHDDLRADLRQGRRLYGLQHDRDGSQRGAVGDDRQHRAGQRRDAGHGQLHGPQRSVRRRPGGRLPLQLCSQSGRPGGDVRGGKRREQPRLFPGGRWPARRVWTDFRQGRRAPRLQHGRHGGYDGPGPARRHGDCDGQRRGRRYHQRHDAVALRHGGSQQHGGSVPRRHEPGNDHSRRQWRLEL